MHMGLDALILTRNSLGIDRDESSTYTQSISSDGNVALALALWLPFAFV